MYFYYYVRRVGNFDKRMKLMRIQKTVIYDIVVIASLFFTSISGVYAKNDIKSDKGENITTTDSDTTISTSEDMLKIFKIYHDYFDGWFYLTNLSWCDRHTEKCYGRNDIFCDDFSSDNKFNPIMQDIKEKIKYTIINPQDKKCFCKNTTNYGISSFKYRSEYKDNTDECILIRRRFNDYKDIYYFDYKKFLPADLPNMTPKEFKEYMEIYHILEGFKEDKCFHNRDIELTSTERQECSKNIDTYMVNSVYKKHKKCINTPPYKQYTDYEKMIKKPLKEKIEFEIDNNCSL